MLTILFLLIIWWAVSALFAVDAQKLLRAFSRADNYIFLDLFFIQNVIGIVMCCVIQRLTALFTCSNNPDPSQAPKPKGIGPGGNLYTLHIRSSPSAIIASFMHALGTGMTNLSLQYLGSTSTQVVKLLEPVTTAFLKYFCLHLHTSKTSMTGIILILVGVATFSKSSRIVTISETTNINMITFIPILLANIAYPARNVLLKKLRDIPSFPTAIDRYFHLQVLAFPPLTVIAIIKIILGYFFSNKYQQYLSLIEHLPSLVRNACLFNVYQLASVTILQKLDPVSHALGNTAKRFVSIVLSIILLRESFGYIRWFGLIIASVGFTVYIGGQSVFSDRRKGRIKVAVFTIVVVAAIALVAIVSTLSLTGVRVFYTSSKVARDRSGSKVEKVRVDNRNDGKMHEMTDFANGKQQHKQQQQEETSRLKHGLFRLNASTRAEGSKLEDKVDGAHVHDSGQRVTKSRQEEDRQPRKGEEKNIMHSWSKPRMKIAYYNHYKGYKSTPLKSWSEADHLVPMAGNVGNFVWQRAGELLLDMSHLDVCSTSDTTYCTEQRREQSLIHYLPTSNIIQHDNGEPGNDAEKSISWMYKRALRYKGRPFIFVGIGSQVEFDQQERDLSPGWTPKNREENFRLGPQTRKLFEMIRNDSAPIFVRGTYTERILQLHGLRNAVATGCPSLMMNTNPNMGIALEKQYQKIADRVNDTSIRLAMNMPPKFLPKLITFYHAMIAKYPNSVIFLQDERDLKILKIAERELHVPKIPIERVRFHTDVRQWQESICEFDALLGSRIHGSMIAFVCDVPVFVIATDHRVRELAEVMLVPHTTVYDPRVNKDTFDFAKVIGHIGFSGKAFDDNRCRLAKTYIEKLAPFGVPVAPHLHTIAEKCS